jgi:hypothetical protein
VTGDRPRIDGRLVDAWTFVTEDAGCDHPATCIVPSHPTAHGWRCEDCFRYLGRTLGEKRHRRREASS